VVAAVAFREPRRPDALRLLNGADLLAPVLLEYELAAVARKKITARPDLRAQHLRALRWALGLSIELHPFRAEPVVELALQSGLTTYDAAYLWLAREVGAELATLDARLVEAAARLL
jgi:predicted nucleic acid-binding protein